MTMQETVFHRLPTAARVVGADVLQSSFDTHADHTHLHAAIRWLYRSQDVTGCDGSSAGYNLILGWQGPYPETTGYIAATLFEYASQYNRDAARERAIAMCDWLLTTQRAAGGFPEGTDPTPQSEMNVFNTGQIILGLVAAYEATGDPKYRDAVARACSWLTEAQSPEGYWEAYDYKDEIHAYSSRIAWSLLKGWELTGTEDFRAAARANLAWVAAQQTANTWFRYAAFEAGNRPFLHTVAYTIRGLLEGSSHLEDSLGFEAAKRTADTLLEFQQHHGVLRGAYDEEWESAGYHCLTGNAQMAIIWLRLFEITGEEEYRQAARRSIEFLKQTHRVTGPASIRGAIKGSHPIWGRYMYLRYPNWATKFFVDAIMKADSLTGDQ